MFTSLGVASPRTTGLQIPFVSPSAQPLSIDEGIEVVTTPASVNREKNCSAQEPEQRAELHSPDRRVNLGETVATTPTTNMGDFNPVLQHDFTGTYPAPQIAQASPFQLGQYLTPTLLDDATGENPTLLDDPANYEIGNLGVQETTRAAPTEGDFTGVAYPSLNVTRQEILTLSSVLERIPQSFMSGEGVGANQPLSLTVVDQTLDPTLLATSSQEDLPGPSSSRLLSSEGHERQQTTHGKRRRPRYSLTVSMLRKHPVLKFFATGPLDAEKTPYKWWCRVCRTELSLMSRGPLELISHYRSDAHLTKEHRIRMEIPGTPLFDKDGKEILGIALQEAKKVARDSHPIAPQLDSRHPLVGQSAVPALGVVSSPTDKVLFQIAVLEHGLRHGGHIKSLTGIYEELSRLMSNDQSTTQNWSEQRVFVSTFLYLADLS